MATPEWYSIAGKTTIPVYFDNISVKQEVNSAVEREKTSVPAALTLVNHPNPFRDRTVIEFELVQDAKVELDIYDYLGRLVRTLKPGFLAAGRHSVPFVAKDLNSGVYFYKSRSSGGAIRTGKMIILR